MKKMILSFIILALVFILCSCGFVRIDNDLSVQLVYKYVDTDIEVELTTKEAKEIIKILNNKALVRDNPSCGFDENIAFVINGNAYSPARDDCCIIKDCESGKYISITQEERDYIEKVFSNYGGHFPCV